MNESFTFLDGLSVSLFSMTVVFVVLLLLSFILGLFSKILDKYAKDAPVETIKPRHRRRLDGARPGRRPPGARRHGAARDQRPAHPRLLHPRRFCSGGGVP